MHIANTDYKGHRRRASPKEPQYEIKTDHIAMHKGARSRSSIDGQGYRHARPSDVAVEGY